MNTERILPKKTCELKRQIDSQALEIWHTRTGFEQSRREQALLHEELADRERSVEKLEELKREHEFRLEEFLIRKLVENHLQMSNLYAVDKYFTFQFN